MNLAETELVVEAKLSQKQMDSLEALLDNEGVSDVNIVSYNGQHLALSFALKRTPLR